MATAHLISTAAAATLDGKPTNASDKTAKTKKKVGNKGSSKQPNDTTPPSASNKNSKKGKNPKSTTVVEAALSAPTVHDSVEIELDESAVRQLKIQLDQFKNALISARKKLDKTIHR